MRLLWLPEVLRGAGCKVATLDGWETRGKQLTAVEGVVWHHTATGTGWTDQRVADLLRDGRSDLAGPLAQLGLQRDGTFVVVASGKANHNGYGTWGNQTIGIEAYNDGKGEQWPPEMVQAWVKGTAAILAHLGYGAERMKGHRETDPKRKPDPVGIDLVACRQRIAPLITYQPPTPTPEPEETFMAALTPDEQRELLTKTREVHEQLTVSRDDKGGKPTVRWLLAKAKEYGSDLVSGRRPQK